MPFTPKYSQDEVDLMIASGELSLMEIYRLKHQHPLNRLTHWIGIPLITASAAYPLYAWFAWGEFAWIEMVVLGGIGWGLQFLGHFIEGNRPAFFQNPLQLLVGPIFFLRKLGSIITGN